jgi:hypothetical protein
VEVVSPYAAADLPALQYKQIGDVMWLVHTSYPPYKLERTTATTFTLTQITYANGPFLQRHDIASSDGTTLTCTGIAPNASGTLTASANTFDYPTAPATSGHIGALFKLILPRTDTTIDTNFTSSKYGPPMYIKGDWQFKTGGTWTATVVVQRNVDDQGWNAFRTYTSNADNNVADAFVEDENNVQYRVYVSDYTSGTIKTHIISNNPFVEGIVRIVTVSDSKTATVGVVSQLAYPVTKVITGVADDGSSHVQITANGHGLSNLDTVRLDAIQGSAQLMAALNNKTFIVADKGTNTFNLKSVTYPNNYIAWDPAFTYTADGDTYSYASITTPVTKQWAEGAWSKYRGYPGAIGFHGDRIVYGGSPNNPGRAWFSKVDDYENFAIDVKDADPFEKDLTTTNQIRWIESMDAVCIGTSGDEWIIFATKLGEALTPINSTAKCVSTNGSAAIQAVRVGQAVLYVDYVKRKVYEMSMKDFDTYISVDMTILAEHITLGGVTGLTLQKSPQPILWFPRVGGTLLSFTYDRIQNVEAWARHTTGIVVSAAAMPGSTEDEVWLAVQRTFGSNTYVFVERFAQRGWALRSHAHYADCASIYNSTASKTITGLGHLNGQSSLVFADGVECSKATPSSGSITLAAEASYVIVGLDAAYILEPNRIVIGTQNGSSIGSQIKVSELVVSFLNSMAAKYGKDTTTLYSFPWQTTTAYTSSTLLYTGDLVAQLDANFDPDTPFVIAGTGSLPCTVRSIVARLQVTGR